MSALQEYCRARIVTLVQERVSERMIMASLPQESRAYQFAKLRYEIIGLKIAILKRLGGDA